MIHDTWYQNVVRVNHDILDGIGAKPGGAYNHQVFHGQKM
jgi:hypothetical protein